MSDKDIKEITNFLAKRYNLKVDKIKKDNDQFELASLHGEKSAYLETIIFIFQKFAVAPDIELKN